MNSNKACPNQAQKEIDEMNLHLKLAKKPTPMKLTGMNEHLARILTWSRGGKCSKKTLVALIKKHLNLEVTGSQAYYFVCKHNGSWPNGHSKSKQIK